LGDPYVASPTDIFQAGWRFRLRAQSSQASYLYLVNQGPDETERARLWILYPQKASVGPVMPGRPTITGWFVFDANPGIEKLWLVWSRNPLDTIERPLGSGHGGRVESQDTASAIQRLLAGLKRGPRTSALGGATRLESTGLAEPVGDLLELRHQ
jgi:hypothetical protein